MLQKHLVAIVAVHTAENDPSKVCLYLVFISSLLRLYFLFISSLFITPAEAYRSLSRGLATAAARARAQLKRAAPQRAARDWPRHITLF